MVGREGTQWTTNRAPERQRQSMWPAQVHGHGLHSGCSMGPQEKLTLMNGTEIGRMEYTLPISTDSVEMTPARL